MATKNRLTVEIFGQTYPIVAKASPNYVRQVASHVDQKMRELAESNPRLDLTRLAVLSAVNIADEYLRLKQEYEEIIHLIEDETP
jgi:cell division protein ZapA